MVGRIIVVVVIIIIYLFIHDFFFYSRGFVFISRFLQWVCLILNETKPTCDTIGD